MKRITIVGISFLALSILLFGLKYYPCTWLAHGLLIQMYPNWSSEFLSISITILLIDYLYGIKETQNNKKRLIRELGSEDKGFTSRALKEIKELGYLTDGTLNGIDLTKANLEGLDFSGGNGYSDPYYTTHSEA